ncbi:MAG TPA: hypothetical protein VF587_17120 [Solirubrobacteraceae bacterium]
MTRVHVAARVLGLVFALTLWAPPGRASASCGGVRTAYPPKAERQFAPPLAIGDSVMLGAVPEVARAGLEVNTRGCRPMSEGLRVLRARKRTFLPSRVVIALGANWTVSFREIRAAMRIVGRRRLLVLVTPRESGGGQSRDAWAMRRAARRFPRRVRVLDWVRVSRGHGGWFSGDGLHLSGSGARAFARLLHRATRMRPPRAPRRGGGRG